MFSLTPKAIFNSKSNSFDLATIFTAQTNFSFVGSGANI